MCLLFFALNPDPKPDGYKLVLVNVRDEFYARPAKPAHFWLDNETVVGGQVLAYKRLLQLL